MELKKKLNLKKFPLFQGFCISSKPIGKEKLCRKWVEMEYVR